jgi:hypothetical protein
MSVGSLECLQSDLSQVFHVIIKSRQLYHRLNEISITGFELTVGERFRRGLGRGRWGFPSADDSFDGVIENRSYREVK